MFKTFLGGKIHRATVTGANLNYVGSITVDVDLLEAAGIDINEKVQIVNNNNGERFETYTIAGRRGSGEVCLNGAAARHVLLSTDEIKTHLPKVVLVDERNQITDTLSYEPANTVL